MKYKYQVNGKTYILPQEEVEAFLKAFPSAQLIGEIPDEPGKLTPTGQGAPVEPTQAPNMAFASGGTSLAYQDVAVAAPRTAERAKQYNQQIYTPDQNVSFTESVFNNFAAEAAKIPLGLMNLQKSIAMSVLGAFNKYTPEEKIELEAKLDELNMFLGMPAPDINQLEDVVEHFESRRRKAKYSSISEAWEKGDYEEAAKMSIEGFAAATPIVATIMTGYGGLIASGASIAGNKFDEEFDANPEEALGKLWVNAAGTGGIEVLFDRYTLGLGRHAKTLWRAGKASAAKDALDNGYKALAKNLIGKGVAGEAAMEAATELSLIAYDNLTLGKEIPTGKDLKYRVFDAAILGGMMGGTITSVGELGGARTYSRVAAENLLMPTEYNNKIKLLTSELNEEVSIKANMEGEINNQTSLDKINDISSQIATIKHVNSVFLSRLNPDQLSEYAANKDEISRLYEYGKALKEQGAKKSLQEQNIKRLNELETRNMDILEAATMTFAANKLENTRKGVEKIVGGLNPDEIGMVTFGKDGTNNEGETFEEFRKKLVEEGTLSKNAGHGYGFIFTKNGKRTIVVNEQALEKGDIGVTVAAHEFLHHTMWKGIRENPEIAKVLAAELVNEVQKHDRNFFIQQENFMDFSERLTPGRYDQSELDPSFLSSVLSSFQRRIAGYEVTGKERLAEAEETLNKRGIPQRQKGDLLKYIGQEVDATTNEEIITGIFDALSMGAIDYNETLLSNIGGVLRRTMQELGVGIKFNNSKDVFNFVKDLGKSIERGRLNPAQKKIIQDGFEGKLIDYARNSKEYRDFERIKKKYDLKDQSGRESKKVGEKIRKMFEQIGNKTEADKYLIAAEFEDTVRKYLQRQKLVGKEGDKKAMSYEQWIKDNAKEPDSVIEDLVRNILYGKNGIQYYVGLYKEGMGTIDGYINTVAKPHAVNAAYNKIKNDIILKDNVNKIDADEAINKLNTEGIKEAGPDPEDIEKEIAIAKARSEVNVVDTFKFSGGLKTTSAEQLKKGLITGINKLIGDEKKRGGKISAIQQGGIVFRSDLKSSISNAQIPMLIRGEMQTVPFSRVVYEDIKNQYVKETGDTEKGHANRAWRWFVTNNAESLYDWMSESDIMERSKTTTKGKAKTLNRWKDLVTVKVKADGSKFRSDVNYAGYDSYAGNAVYKKKRFEDVKDIFIELIAPPIESFPKGNVKHWKNPADKKRWRDSYETQRRSITSLLAAKIGFDQINEVLKDEEIAAYFDVIGVELNSEIIEALNRQIKQGAFKEVGTNTSLDKLNDLFPDTVLEMRKQTPEIQARMNINGESLGKATLETNSNIPEEFAFDIETELDNYYFREARKTDNKNGDKYFKNLNSKSAGPTTFTKMIERKGKAGQRAKMIQTGEQTVLAKKLGQSQDFWDRVNPLINSQAEDFYGLISWVIGKGKQGDADFEWVSKHIFEPYETALVNIDKERVKVLTKHKKIINTLKDTAPGLKLGQKLTVKSRGKTTDKFTLEDAIRFKLWKMKGVDLNSIKGVDNTTIEALIKEVDKLAPDLAASSGLGRFIMELNRINGMDGYPPPTSDWSGKNIKLDILDFSNTNTRKKHLRRWKINMDKIFNDKNIAKLTAAYGSRYVTALQNTIKRMETGRNNEGYKGDKYMSRFHNYVNGSVGTIMALNRRSALLQMMSNINFINWSDNNPINAAKAFYNQPQYWGDVMYLMGFKADEDGNRSEFLTSRRRGMRINVQEAEIAAILRDAPKDQVYRRMIGMLLDKGFVLTKFADSIAIATGGAAFYRNRINTYLKQGMSMKQAKEKAHQDYRINAAETQQSADPSRISEVQASPLGRLVFAFGNTPFQYARVAKKSVDNLINGRGDAKTNISKILYYQVIQNFLFHGLRSALLFELLDGDEEKDEEKRRAKLFKDTTRGMRDSSIKGLGLQGAFATAVLAYKKALLDEKDNDNPLFEEDNKMTLALASISPPLQNKLRKFYKIQDAIAKDEESWTKMKFEHEYPSNYPASIEASANIGELLNLPTTVALKYWDSYTALSEGEYNRWEAFALAAGWGDWELGIDYDREYGPAKKGGYKGRRKKITRKKMKKRTKK